jgi:hypothetical protein
MVSVWDTTIGNSARIVLTLLEATGVLEEGAVEAFDNMVSNVKKSLDEFADDSAEFAAGNERRSDSIDSFFDKTEKAVSKSVEKILTAQKAELVSFDKSTKARGAAADVAVKTSAEIAKAVAAAAKLESEILKSQETALQKASRVREDFTKRVAEQEEQGVIDAQKAADLRIVIEQDFIDAKNSRLTRIKNRLKKRRRPRTKRALVYLKPHQSR